MQPQPLYKLVSDLEKLYEHIVFTFYDFEKDPEKVNEFAGTQLAYKFYYTTNSEIKFEMALIYLKYKCQAYINGVNTITLLYNVGSLVDDNVNPRHQHDYDFFREEIDEIISLELEVDRRLKNEVGIETRPIERTSKKPGPKRDNRCDLTTEEYSKLFWFLAESKTIPGKRNKTHIANIVSDASGITSDYAKRSLNDIEPDEIGLSKAQKKNLIDHLNETIKIIEASK